MRTEPDAASASESASASGAASASGPRPGTAADRVPESASDSGPAGAMATGRLPALAALSLLGAGYLLQLLGLLLAAVVPVVVGAALGLLTEAWLLRQRPALARALGRAQLHHPVRQLLRDGLMFGGLARLDALRPLHYAAWLLVAVLGCWSAHFLCQAVAARVRKSRRFPVVTRNIDASALRIGPAPPPLFGGNGSARLLACTSLVTAGIAATAVTGNARWGAAVALVCWALLLTGVLHLACRLLPGRRPAGEEEVLAWLDGWLAAYRPTVGMYFSGGVTSAYQANMWLSTLAGLGGRPVIVLRERFMVQKLDATDIPIVCIPKVAHLMRLETSGLPVLLHPANSGKTSHVLRIPTVKHAFINHGESDKLSSCNPYAKAYDEVWVAGPAARERYRLAGIGVRDEDVREVGRPQLESVRPYAGPPAPDAPVTVLYAPTWEGWTDDPGNTSLVLAGENVVRALLAEPGVRLLYKPHPMTGSVDPAMGEADRRIRELIAEANARRARPAGAEAEQAAAEAEQARADLERCEERLAAVDGAVSRRGRDEAERMLWQHPGAWPSAATVMEAVEEWEECFWRACDPGEHLVLAGQRPGIYSCFNQADLLVSDVSSVVSDYLGSEKPYAVVNTTGLAEEEFRSGFPTVRAASILTPDAAGVPAVLASVRDPSADLLRPARAQLKEHLLGPDEPPPAVRFRRAVDELRARAEAHQARRGDGTEAEPGGRATEAGAAAAGGGSSAPTGTALAGSGTAVAGTAGTDDQPPAEVLEEDEAP